MSRDELSRLRFGPEIGQVPGGLGVSQITVHCPQDAEAVLDRAKQTMIAVLQEPTEPWPSLEDWNRSLPKWFTREFAPEMSEKEKADWIAWWDTLGEPEKQKFSREHRWMLSGWTYYFRPEKRTWFWWDAGVTDRTTIWIDVQTVDWPCPLGSLYWLLRVSGATSMEPQVA